MDWMKNKKTQNTIAIILAVVLILIFFFINTMIKRTIEETSEIPSQNTQASVMVHQGSSKEIPPKASEAVTVKKEISTPSKSQTSTSQENKEIIYEPSIKGNILLQ